MYTWILYFRWYPSLSITIKGSPERKNTLSWMMKLPMEASWKSLKLLIKYCTSKHHCVKHVSKGYLIATMRPSIFPDCFVNWRSKATKLDIITLSVGKSRTKHQKRCNLNEVKKNCKNSPSWFTVQISIMLRTITNSECNRAHTEKLLT